MPAGRPTSYKPEYCADVIESGKIGRTLAEMAADIGVDRATIKDWQSTHPEFSSAIKTGLDHAQAWWTEMGRKMTFGLPVELPNGEVLDPKNFNATSYIFQMKNRFREDWSDVRKTEIAGVIGVEHTHTVDVGALTYESREALRAALLPLLAPPVEDGEFVEVDQPGDSSAT